MSYAAPAASIVFGSAACRTLLAERLRRREPVRLMTYSLPDYSALVALFADAVAPVRLIAGERFRGRAELLKAACPKLDVALHPGTHAKIALLSPDVVIVGSSNLGDSGWIEADAACTSSAVYAEAERLFEAAWRESERLREQPATTSTLPAIRTYRGEMPPVEVL